MTPDTSLTVSFSNKKTVHDSMQNATYSTHLPCNMCSDQQPSKFQLQHPEVQRDTEANERLRTERIFLSAHDTSRAVSNNNDPMPADHH
jgi:hypothetical protein